LALRGLLSRIAGDSDQREIARLQEVVEGINERESGLEKLSGAELRARTDEFRQLLADGGSLDDILVDAFAAVREAAKRTIGMRHYDVQLIGGAIMHQGKIVEMKTGEGKTLVATLPLYLNALVGQGVHLVTVNSYLARRDGGWMGPVFDALGMSVGLVNPQFSGLYDYDYIDPTSHLEDERLVHWRPVRRQEAYRADITYGTSNEFGFDYLRDNTSRDLDMCVQRPLHFAIIDEVDNVLIDEARTPLIISGPVRRTADKYGLFDAIAAKLRPNTAGEDEEPNGDFDLDEKTRSVYLTERGIGRVERELQEAQEIGADKSIYDPQHSELVHYLENALKARRVFLRDKDYVVTESQEVVLVDSRTGRLMPGRRYSEGLHQAIEAKEGVRIRSETVTVATVTIQKYFRLYSKLAGMTGTAAMEKEEFRQIYDLDVVSLPTNIAYQGQLGVLTAEKRRLGEIEETDFAGIEPRYHNTDVTVYRGEDGLAPSFERVDFADVIYLNQQAKLEAVVGEIAAMQEVGRPVLVGTTSVESSEHLHSLLDKAKIEHSVLNAKRHTEEALIIAQAGQPGAVTVATSMAGRGTDIILGGNPEGLAARYINEHCFALDELIKIVRLVVEGKIEEARKQAEAEKRLGLETLAWVEEAHSEFAARSDQVTKRGVVPVIVPEVLQAFGDVAGLPDRARYAEAVRALVTYIRRGHVRTARERAGAMGLPAEQIDWIAKWIQDYYAYRRQPTRFLASELFNRHYSARMALVRTVLADDVAEAGRIVSETTDLSEELIEGIRRIQDEWAEKRHTVWKLGGMHVLGTERYEARRIDDQFRGRAARQGDPGTSRFYLSLDDELMRRFASENVTNLMERFQFPDDVPIEAKVLTRTVESAQQRLEGYYFDMRKHLLEYDEVVSRQRDLIYAERHEILVGDLADLREKVRDYFEEELDRLAGHFLEDPEAWIGGEILSAIADYSNPELDESSVNALAVVRRLRGILPVLDPNDKKRGGTPEAAALRERLEAVDDAEILQQELEALVDPVLDDQHHIRLFVRSVATLMPLGLPVEFLQVGDRARWEATKALRAIDQEALGFQALTLINLGNAAMVDEGEEHYRGRVERYLDTLLDGSTFPELRQEIQQQVDEANSEAFGRLRALVARSPSKSERGAQLAAARVRLHEGVEEALMALVRAVPQEQAVLALMNYYDRVLTFWEEHIAYRSVRGFLGRFGAISPDREEEQLLRGPVQIEQELAQEVGGFLAAQSEEEYPLTEEQWQAIKSSYRPDSLKEVAQGPLAEYETAFAGWLADRVAERWETQSNPLPDGSRAALGQHLVEFLASARSRLASLELQEFLRWLVLTRLDGEWIQYLEAIDRLRQGIGLQAYAQRSPQVEFRRQAFDMFDGLRERVQQQIVKGFFSGLPNYHSFVQHQRELLRVRGETSGDYRVERTRTGQIRRVRDVKIGRNDPCWCGSGQKYKQCHMQSDMKKQGSQGGAPSAPRAARSKKRRRKGRRR
jgi:preprotein translocase subunit SecA